MTAFEIGWMHAEYGQTLAKNPFARQTGEWLAWRNGWRAFWSSLGVDN